MYKGTHSTTDFKVIMYMKDEKPNNKWEKTSCLW